MKILLNTTKTMTTDAELPARLPATTPRFGLEAARLMKGLQRFSAARLARELAVSGKLADETKAITHHWGGPGEVKVPALFAFSGLVYKYVDVANWSSAQIRAAQKSVSILSGLYGLLRPLDLIAPYRLEMGSRIKPPRAANLVQFWQQRLTEACNETLKRNEPVLNLAAQEYSKALLVKALNGPLISPIFKEVRGDGSLKTAPVYAKMARGAMVKYCVQSGAGQPRDLLDFGEMGWEATREPPEQGAWLFTRPARD